MFLFDVSDKLLHLEKSHEHIWHVIRSTFFSLDVSFVGLSPLGNSLPIKLTLMTTQVASMIEMCFIFKLKLINLTLLGSFGVLNSTDASLSCGLLCVIRLLFRPNKKLLHVTSISLIGWYKEQESRTPDLL